MSWKHGWLFALVVFTVLQGLECASWSSDLKDGQVKYACADNALIIPWQLNLTNGQTVNDIQWYFHGQSEEMIAILSHGNFMPMPAFAQRVKQVGNAGIQVSHLIVGDSGNYSVEVTVQDASGGLIPLRQTIYVHVGDGLMTTDGSLHASLLPQAVLDNSTQQFALVLTCGHFTYLGHPPFDVLWTNPLDNTILSSSYSEGFFRLFLSTPVMGGTYSCQVPSSAATAACLPATTNATVNVDETTARLSLLEASLEVTKETDAQQKASLLQQSQRIHDLEDAIAQVPSLKNQVSQLNETNAQQKASLLQQSQRIHDLEDAQVPSLKNQVSQLNQQLHDMATRQVSFHVKLSNYLRDSPTRIVFDEIVNNLGNAYSSSTGYFTAPYAADTTSRRASFLTSLHSCI